MISERLREILFFFRGNIIALLVVTLPFAVAASFIVHTWGEPVIIDGTKPIVMHAQSALLLVLLYPLALGVKIVAIHRLARGEGIAFGPLLADAMRAWPVMAGISLLLGAAVGGGLFLFIIPGIWCYARLGYAPILAVTEGLGVLPALVASWQRTQENQFELFTLTMLIGSALVTIV